VAGRRHDCACRELAAGITATGFCADVERVLRASGLEPDALTLEVTESTLFQDTEAVAATIECVRALGVHLALDDFGTGYSSLVYLRRFHVEVIKIDQSFVRGIGRDPEDELIIRGIIDLARSLGISLVAEGVETEAEADWLVAAGCTELQGFLYARPHPAEDLRHWLRTFEGSRHRRPMLTRPRARGDPPRGRLIERSRRHPGQCLALFVPRHPGSRLGPKRSVLGRQADGHGAGDEGPRRASDPHRDRDDGRRLGVGRHDLDGDR
jgi:hypothetical protein